MDYDTLYSSHQNGFSIAVLELQDRRPREYLLSHPGQPNASRLDWGIEAQVEDCLITADALLRDAMGNAYCDEQPDWLEMVEDLVSDLILRLPDRFSIWRGQIIQWVVARERMKK